MSGAYGTCGDEKKFIPVRGFGGGHLKERDHLGGLDVDGWILLKWILKKYDGRTWTGIM